MSRTSKSQWFTTPTFRKETCRSSRSRRGRRRSTSSKRRPANATYSKSNRSIRIGWCGRLLDSLEIKKSKNIASDNSMIETFMRGNSRNSSMLSPYTSRWNNSWTLNGHTIKQPRSWTLLSLKGGRLTTTVSRKRRRLRKSERSRGSTRRRWTCRRTPRKVWRWRGRWAAWRNNWTKMTCWPINSTMVISMRWFLVSVAMLKLWIGLNTMVVHLRLYLIPLIASMRGLNLNWQMSTIIGTITQAWLNHNYQTTCKWTL